jgi:general secretion pathway protein E
LKGLGDLRTWLLSLEPREVDGRGVWPELLRRANGLDVTDVHLEPTAEGARVRVRRDGELIELAAILPEVRDRLVMALKNQSGMTAYVHSRPQDGRLRLDGLSVRAATLPVLHGEKVTLRILPSVERIRPLESLGIDDVDRFLRLLRERPGMTLCVGPAGSGKSTTLYATLLRIYHDAGGHISVATIEDPVEYEVPWFNQTPVNLEKGLTFAAGLRSIVRHDPNAILVGEIRDRETAATAFQAALSGHLVMSTLHGTDPIGALQRLLDMGVEPDVLSGGLCAVVGQRLVPRVCDACRGAGCEACEGSGRQGRIGIFEILEMGMELAEGLRERLSADGLRGRVPGRVDLAAALQGKIDAGLVPARTKVG